MCGVDVLDKGCGGIHVQVYVGCRVFEVVKSYLCVSVPVLDDDCGAFVCFVYDDSIMDHSGFFCGNHQPKNFFEIPNFSAASVMKAAARCRNVWYFNENLWLVISAKEP